MKNYLTIHPADEHTFAEGNVEFDLVPFTAPTGMSGEEVELILRDLPGCHELVQFTFSISTGEGSFILLVGRAEPGNYPIRRPTRYVLEVDNTLTYNGKDWGTTLRHIESEPWHALCGAERDAKETKRLRDERVNCSVCRDLWVRSKAWESEDFTDSIIEDAPQKTESLEKESEDIARDPTVEKNTVTPEIAPVKTILKTESDYRNDREYMRIEPGIKPMCDTLNSYNSIVSLYSCEGHPRRPARPYVSFRAELDEAELIQDAITACRDKLTYNWWITGCFNPEGVWVYCLEPNDVRFSRPLRFGFLPNWRREWVDLDLEYIRHSIEMTFPRNLRKTNPM